jgi:predicted metalloprotease with PDZ domain
MLQTLLALALASAPVLYEIRFENADHHEAEVTATFAGVTEDVLELRMSRSSPGRYALHEFAKNVYRVRAEDSKERALEITRPDPHQWNVRGHDGTVVFRYTVFGDRLDGTYLAIDNTHAHLNMPATFVWARGLESRGIELTIYPSREDFTVATQLEPTSQKNVFRARDLDYFLDSPTEIGPIHWHEWSVESNGRSQTVRLALHHLGAEDEARTFARLAQAVVEEQARIFGELPRFDYGTYTFIADYLPYASGDGMEHRNSTVLTSRAPLEDPLRNLGTVSHEFFHAWNVERIRPRSLEPFDFERANMSGELWFAEGFTSYYDDLTLKRAGITSLDRYARDIGGALDGIVNAPGRGFFSPVEMSMQAPFVDAAVSIDPTNRENTYASYYPYGAVLALGLDLSIRERYPERSLDDVMRAAWLAHGRNEVPYTLEDLEGILGEVTDPDFAAAFFGEFVRKGDLPDFERLLALAGLELKRPGADEPWLGASLSMTAEGARIESRPLLGSPLYEAGAELGDVVQAIGGVPIDSGTNVEELLARSKVSARCRIAFEKRGEAREREVVLKGDPRLEVVPFERSGREVTKSIVGFRERWLESSAARTEVVRRRCGVCRRTFEPELSFCPYDGQSLVMEARP